MQVVLASGSPRRLSLLRRLGIDPLVQPAGVDETPRPGESPAALAERLARAKLEATQSPDSALAIAADTVVAIGPRVLGKPEDEDDAARMLRALAGRTHQVLTGVAVRRHGQVHAGVATTNVTFRELTSAEIDWYVATGESLDKAGAYALQGAGAVLVDRIDGSDTNVIGLPLVLLVMLARRTGADLLT